MEFSWEAISGILVALFYASALPVGVLLAQNRGRSGWIGLAFAMFLGWFGVLIVAILPREREQPPWLTERKD